MNRPRRIVSWRHIFLGPTSKRLIQTKLVNPYPYFTTKLLVSYTPHHAPTVHVKPLLVNTPRLSASYQHILVPTTHFLPTLAHPTCLTNPALVSPERLSAPRLYESCRAITTAPLKPIPTSPCQSTTHRHHWWFYRLISHGGRLTIRTMSTLSSRELQVLAAVQDGNTNKEIARGLGISLSTVNKHLEHIYFKLAAKNRTHAVTLSHLLK